jgi:hypothetical protein
LVRFGLDLLCIGLPDQTLMKQRRGPSMVGTIAAAGPPEWLAPEQGGPCMVEVERPGQSAPGGAESGVRCEASDPMQAAGASIAAEEQAGTDAILGCTRATPVGPSASSVDVTPFEVGRIERASIG